jgi:steroid 5-alpha reductase family enzyme
MPLFMICASIGFILHWLVFIPAYIYQTEHYFDLTGSLSYIATLITAVSLHPNLDARGLVLSVMIAIWATRLGSFLFMRVKKAGQDRRFSIMKTIFLRYLLTWTLGGCWVFVTMAAGLAAITSTTQAGIDTFLIIGCSLWVFGFGFEVIADRQKTIFRKNSENSNNFITSGLWSITRHPNYFGEIILWVGITVAAFPALSGWQLITLMSPIFVTLLLIKVSGVKLLEASGQERWGSDPEYQSYLANTPVLVPFLGRIAE